MTKYLIFDRDKDLTDAPAYGSSEAIACEIASIVDMRELAERDYMAVPVDSPKATMAAIKSIPKMSIEITQQHATAWSDDARGLVENFYSLREVIDNAYSMILDAVEDLETSFESSLVFEGTNLIDGIDTDNAFQFLNLSTEHELVGRLSERFNIQRFSDL